MLHLNLDYVFPFIEEKKLFNMKEKILAKQETLLSFSGPGNDFLGWIDLPGSHSRSFLQEINRIGEEISEKVDTLVLVGIGGSYLGARAVYESLQDPFGLNRNQFPEIVYAGHHLDGNYLISLLKYLEHRSYAVIVISKSGTTTEPAIAFRLLKDQMVKKWGAKEAAQRIIAITDEKKGALRKLADEEGYRSYIIPDNVGGRYSVLTPVGLVPLALGGIAIELILEGASQMKILSERLPFEGNPVLLYVAARNALYSDGKYIELMVNYHPRLHYFTEWWKQLFGESEGKDHKGLFPASVDFTTDLHSLGQYIQEGQRILFETVLTIKNQDSALYMPADSDDTDGLNYLTSTDVQKVNRMAELGTILAHVDGGVPNVLIEIESLDERAMGALIYFFEKACAISGYVLGINPFDQPGVEAYKKNMFALLGKPGFEKETKQIREKLRQQG